MNLINTKKHKWVLMWPYWKLVLAIVAVARGLISRHIIPGGTPLGELCEACWTTLILCLTCQLFCVLYDLPPTFSSSSCLIGPAHKYPVCSSLSVGLSSKGQMNKQSHKLADPKSFL